MLSCKPQLTPTLTIKPNPFGELGGHLPVHTPSAFTGLIVARGDIEGPVLHHYHNKHLPYSNLASPHNSIATNITARFTPYLFKNQKLYI